MPTFKLTNIQILRGLAAVCVVVFHALGLIGHAENVNPLVAVLGRYGYFGVDIFFVVSGFVIYYSVHAKQITAKEFFQRRAERIVPPYFVLTTALFFAMLLRPSLFHSSVASIDHFVRSVLYLSYTGYQFPVLYIGWTLEYEMYFYVLATVALAFGRHAFNRLPMLFCAVVLLGVAGTKIFGGLVPVGFLVNPIILEFGFGFFTASIFLTRQIDKYNLAAMITALCGVSLAESTNRAILVGLPGAALLFACLALHHRVTLPRAVATPFCALGDASYSIYLIQVFSLPIVEKLLRPYSGELGANTIVMLATCFTILAGWLFYKVVETPVLNALKARRQRATARLMAA
jgi:exopolysaccharide production protein ExoZ